MLSILIETSLSFGAGPSLSAAAQTAGGGPVFFFHLKTSTEAAMLILSRKSGQRIFIGDQITVTVVQIGLNAVRLGIEAPSEMNIVREELPRDRNRKGKDE